MPPSTHRSRSEAERRRDGAEARTRTPLDSHTGWVPADDRPDPVDLLNAQNEQRISELVPLRYGRMAASAFTFFRGAAKVMASDLSSTPHSGLLTQLCGDAHLSNFGGYASPERRLVFDLNDFDETLPGPFEFDVKRMAASFVVAGRNNGLTRKQGCAASSAAVRSYREAMAGFAGMGELELWYSHVSEDDLVRALKQSTARGKGPDKGTKRTSNGSKKARSGQRSPAEVKALSKGLLKARTRDSLQALSKLGEVVDGKYRIASAPPVVVPIREWADETALDPQIVGESLKAIFDQYASSLRADLRVLLEKFTLVDVAHKVVGVGSVGTRAFILLLQGRNGSDPLFLQLKEASRSVLEDHLPLSVFDDPAERVVQGQRLMQATSDIFLGWSATQDGGNFYYWRQLRDMKASVDVEAMNGKGLKTYATLCGWTLARAHARAGDPIALSEYLGTEDTFDRSIVDFAERYAEQNELDHLRFLDAINEGRINALAGI